MTDFPALARRIKTLANKWPALTHTFMFGTGALFALERAAGAGVRDRRSYEDADRAFHAARLQEVTEALATGGEPEVGWTAGFMYNSAIMRLDACYERFLEAIAAELKKQGRLAPAVDASDLSKTERCARRIERSLRLREPLGRVRLEQNRGDVNRLKHRLFGRQAVDERSRTVGDVENAAAAMAELLTILERPEVQASLASAYQDLPPA
jgi:hypothetical protein